MGVRLIAAALILMAMTGAAPAFVVEGPDERPWDPVEDVDRAPRWTAGHLALVDGGPRGLGGGLEIAIDPSLCQDLTILDQPDCALVRAAVMEAARRWEEGHPVLRFTEVGDRIAPAPQADHPPGEGQGAEIDVFAASPNDFAPFRLPGVAAMTVYYFDIQQRPSLTNGQSALLSAGAMQAADIRLSTEACYYLDPNYRRFGCAHLPSIMMHEIGHVLGLDHPDERPDRNLDQDDQPGNVMHIPCMNPTQGLRHAPRIEGGATAIAQVWGDNAWSRGLTNDDVAARDALYPHCDIRVIDRGGPQRWGAFARGEHGATMTVIGATSEQAARSELDATCALRGERCTTVAAFSECFAYAEGVGGAAAGATGAGVQEARDRALALCAESGGACRVREAFCAFE
jgi:hypothetical protein